MPLFQNESSRKTVDMKTSLMYVIMDEPPKHIFICEVSHEDTKTGFHTGVRRKPETTYFSRFLSRTDQTPRPNKYLCSQFISIKQGLP